MRSRLLITIPALSFQAPRPSGLLLVLLAALFLPPSLYAQSAAEAQETKPSSPPPSSSPLFEQLIKGQLDFVLRDCRVQLETEQYDACLNALKALEPQLNQPERPDLREYGQLVALRIKLVEAHKKAGGLRAERPDQSARALFSAYSALPEKFFPYDEVLPYWNLYLRDDSGRSRFTRYRRYKLLVRGPKEDPGLEEAFTKAIQQRLLDFGYLLMDPTTSTPQPDVLTKLAIKLYTPDGNSDPQAQFKKSQRLAMDIQTFKWMQSSHSVKLEPFELESVGLSPEEARGLVIQRGADRMVDLLFYHTLQQMFPPEGDSR